MMKKSNQFQNLGLSLSLTTAVEAAGYTHPTPVQLRAIPPALQGRDLMVAAQTGTGKTASFALPILEKLFCQHPSQADRSRLRQKKTKVLVLTPTRELAAQVHDSFRTYATNVDLVSACIFGGVGMQPQIDLMARGVDVLVACPGRLLDLIGQKAIDLSDVGIFVLDEADRMLDMGFIHDVKKVIARLPERRQNLLYSATFSQDIIALASQLLNSPERVEVTPPNTTVERIVQAVYHVPIANQKKFLLAHLIQAGNWEQALVFTRTKHGANKLAEFLIKQGIESVAIHGNKSQNARTKALADFKAGTVRIMVATDIAARGLDIDQLPHVVNFELPNVEEDYVHRIGRTGRAGRSGEAVSLVSPDENKLLEDIQRMTKQRIPEGDWMGFDLASISQSDLAKPLTDRPGFRGDRRQQQGQRIPEQKVPSARISQLLDKPISPPSVPLSDNIHTADVPSNRRMNKTDNKKNAAVPAHDSSMQKVTPSLLISRLLDNPISPPSVSTGDNIHKADTPSNRRVIKTDNKRNAAAPTHDPLMSKANENNEVDASTSKIRNERGRNRGNKKQLLDKSPEIVPAPPTFVRETGSAPKNPTTISAEAQINQKPNRRVIPRETVDPSPKTTLPIPPAKSIVSHHSVANAPAAESLGGTQTEHNGKRRNRRDKTSRPAVPVPTTTDSTVPPRPPSSSQVSSVKKQKGIAAAAVVTDKKM